MTDEMNLGALRQPLHQIQRVADRAFRHAAMLPRKDPIAIFLGQRAACGSADGTVPQLAEAALATRRGAMQENQDRLVRRDAFVFFARRKRENIAE